MFLAEKSSTLPTRELLSRFWGFTLPRSLEWGLHLRRQFPTNPPHKIFWGSFSGSTYPRDLQVGSGPLGSWFPTNPPHKKWPRVTGRLVPPAFLALVLDRQAGAPEYFCHWCQIGSCPPSQARVARKVPAGLS